MALFELGRKSSIVDIAPVDETGKNFGIKNTDGEIHIRLIDTIHELVSRLGFFSSIKHRNEALRTIPVNEAGAASTITTVTTVSTVTGVTSFGLAMGLTGTGLPAKLLVDAQMNALAVLSNINNCVRP
jgi:hypothetical protein